MFHGTVLTYIPIKPCYLLTVTCIPVKDLLPVDCNMHVHFTCWLPCIPVKVLLPVECVVHISVTWYVCVSVTLLPDDCEVNTNENSVTCWLWRVYQWKLCYLLTVTCIPVKTLLPVDCDVYTSENSVTCWLWPVKMCYLLTVRCIPVRENSNSNSKTLFSKDCSLGSPI